MTKFKSDYEKIRYNNNISEISSELVDSILDIVN